MKMTQCSKQSLEAYLQRKWTKNGSIKIVAIWQMVSIQCTLQRRKTLTLATLQIADEILWRIGSALGTALKVDKLTCVEVDLAKPLESHIVIRGHKLLIEYEGLHSPSHLLSLWYLWPQMPAAGSWFQ